MSYGKVVPVFGRTGLDVNLRNLSALSTRRLQSSVAPKQQNRRTEERAYVDYAVPETDIQADLIQQSRNHASNKNKISVDFETTKEAYKSKDTGELLRSLLVFKLCSYDLLVDKNKEIMDLSKKILGQKTFERIMKMTFYGQFVAGEDHQAIRPLVQRNRSYGVGAVLDYSVEEDLTKEEAENKEME